MGPQTLRCGPTGGPSCQVCLFVSFKGCPDIEMSSYWWSIVSGLHVRIIRGAQTLRCRPIGGLWSQVCLYILYKVSADFEMSSYWSSILSGLPLRIIQGVLIHWDVVLLVVHCLRFYCTCYIRGLPTLRCGPTGGPQCQVSLYLSYKGCPDITLTCCPTGGPSPGLRFPCTCYI